MSTFPIFRMKQGTRSKNQNTRQRSQSLYLIYAGKFIEFRSVLEKAKEIFAREQIWPDQCDYLIYKMKPLRNTVASIASRASSSRKREDSSGTRNHYPLLVSAHDLCDQVDGLMDSIREYREITDHRTRQKSRHQAILNSLHSLDSSLHDLLQELDKTVQNQ